MKPFGDDAVARVFAALAYCGAAALTYHRWREASR